MQGQMDGSHRSQPIPDRWNAPNIREPVEDVRRDPRRQEPSSDRGRHRGHNRGSGNGRGGNGRGWKPSRDDVRRTWVLPVEDDRKTWLPPREESRVEGWSGSLSREAESERRLGNSTGSEHQFNIDQRQEVSQSRTSQGGGARSSSLKREQESGVVQLNGHRPDEMAQRTVATPSSNSQWSQQDVRLQGTPDTRIRDASDHRHSASLPSSRPTRTDAFSREEAVHDSPRMNQNGRQQERGGGPPRSNRGHREYLSEGLLGDPMTTRADFSRRENSTTGNGNVSYSDWDDDPRGGPSSNSPFSTDSHARSNRGVQNHGGRGGRGRGRGREGRDDNLGNRGRGADRKDSRQHDRRRGSPIWRGQSGEDSRNGSERGRGGGAGSGRNEVADGSAVRESAGSVQLRPWHQQQQERAPRGGEMQARVSKLVAGMVPRNLGPEEKSKPQLLQNLEEKLWTGGVDCMICWDSVSKAAPVWSCDNCYAIFHLPCVSKWAFAPTSSDTSAARHSSQPQVDNWRCPGCQKVHAVSKRELRYMCFCNAMVDPPQDSYITPHSCGQTCRKPLNKASSMDESKRSPSEYRCPHLCILRCHPGPCPPCNAMAPSLPCHCGKAFVTKRCSEVERGGWSCNSKCGHQLQCGRHFCEQVCHDGPCSPCKIVHIAPCYCGHDRKDISCTDLAGEKDEGCFSCGRECCRPLACGQHACRRPCHSGPCDGCQLEPSRVHTCPCGRASLKQLGGADRTSCTDPIPTCFEVCGKLLACGDHKCSKRCHMGDCAPCEVMVNKKCRCGTSSRRALCSGKGRGGVGATEIGEEGEFVCESKCGRKKNCGRHRCNGVCCPVQRDGTMVTGSDDPHLCTLICGKKLRCGVHQCEELCHSGHCPPCMNPGFSELSCACGRTSVPPPVPCGTPTPQCPHTCALPQPCGHPATHLCHFGDCPPCTVSVQRMCVGQHTVLNNILCGSKDAKCSAKCGKILRCGAHRCSRVCHSAPCDAPLTSAEGGDGGSPSGTPTAGKAAETVMGKKVLSCGQPCGERRRDCGHPCASPCHPGTPCPENRCRTLVTISCRCSHLTAQVPCGSGTGGSGLVEAACLAKLASGLVPLDNAGASSWLTSPEVPLGKRQLNCDEDCARLERKRVLAAAFGAGEADDLVAREGPEAELAECLRWNPQWVHGAEARLHYMLYAPSGSSQASGAASGRHVGIGSGASRVRVHVFSAVPRGQRACLHQLADRWGMVSTSVGRDPGRFVVVVAGPKSKVPARGLLSRGPTLGPGQVPCPAFNAELDADPACVVAFVDLPREEQLEQLNFTFGGDCELHWANDRNALAVFSDPERAATAMRRLDHTSAYWGASGPPPSSVRTKGAGASSAKAEARAKAAAMSKAPSTSWQGDAWGDEEGRSKQAIMSLKAGTGLSKPGASTAGVAWKPKETGSITVEANFWGALDEGSGETPKGGEESGSRLEQSPAEVPKTEDTLPPSASDGGGGGAGEEEEEWEKVLDAL